MTVRLQCPCGASANDTSKERGRFLSRHLSNCPVPQKIARTKAQATVDNVVLDDDAPDTQELYTRQRGTKR